jgi:UDP-glucose 4-epimerase
MNPDFRGRKVLVTGGLGFIGSALVRRLVELGAHVAVLDSLIPDLGGDPDNIRGLESSVELHAVDLREAEKLGDIIREREVIFNLAAQVSHLESMRHPALDADINVRGQLNLLEACRRENPAARIVFTSTRQVYGRPDCLPVDETHRLNPPDVNASDKLAAEHLHQVYGRAFGIPSVILRMSNTYGPGMRVKDNRKNFVGWWIGQLLKGVEISIYGDGRQVRDLLYVEDAVDALLLAGVAPESAAVFNLGGNEPIVLADLARLLIELNGSGSFHLEPFPPERARIDIGGYASDSTRIRAALGWRPVTPLREGLKQTLDFYREHPERLR